MHPSYPCGPDSGPYGGGVHGPFLHWTKGNAGLVFNLGFATWVVDAEGVAVRKIIDANPGRGDSWGDGQYGYYADVSPDGSRIVYSTCEHTYFNHDAVGSRYNLGYEIAAVNVDGSDLQRLTDNVHFENYPVWSPDGTRIAFIAHNDYRFIEDYDWPAPEHYDTYNAEIFTRSSDGKDERVVPNTKGDELDPVDGRGPPAHPGTRGVGLYPPVWSPDGERLACTAHEGQRARHGDPGLFARILYTVRLDGSELSRIGKATTLPTWSAGGERVAFALDDRVYTVGFDGTDLREVLDDVRANDVSWSPDGTELLLASDRGMYLVRPDGSAKRPAGPRIRTTAATWSPDGSMIAARHETDRYARQWKMQIFITKRGGTGMRVLAQGFVEDNDYNDPHDDELKILPAALASIDPATCSNRVAVAQPEATPSLVRDCEALVRLRNAFGPLAAWTTYTPLADWPGVVVRGNPPRVRELRLRDNVKGTIPPQIGNLTMLEELTLEGNDLLSGQIPPELGKLTMLRTLDLSNNSLSGPIPPELGDLTMLRTLDLSNNSLSGPIPPELGNLTMLRTLRLSNNELSGCVPVELSDKWVEASGLERCKP